MLLVEKIHRVGKEGCFLAKWAGVSKPPDPVAIITGTERLRVYYHLGETIALIGAR